MKLQLSKSEIDIIHQAAAPLPQWDQTIFMARVAELLRQEPEIGDGTVHKCVGVAQREHTL